MTVVVLVAVLAVFVVTRAALDRRVPEPATTKTGSTAAPAGGTGGGR
jgi:hypothetical protein